MSDTPRTDAEHPELPPVGFVRDEFARLLERELNEAKKLIVHNTSGELEATMSATPEVHAVQPPPELKDSHRTTWFSFDPFDGYETHDTEAAARGRAEKALQDERAEAGEGWSEEVTQIAWGKVIQRVEEKWRKQKPPAGQLDEDGLDKDGTDWSQFDELVDYHLCPVLPA